MTTARATIGLALCILLGPSVAHGAGEGPPNWVVPAGQEARILSLVAPNKTLAPVLPGTWFDRIEITDDAIIFVVSGREPPGGPASIHLGWDARAASDLAPPPWRLEVRGDAAPGPLADSVSLLRERIESRLTPELYNGLLSYVADPGGDLAMEAPDWIERVAGTFGLVWRERRSRGLVQYSVRDVNVTAPAIPSVWFLVPLLAMAAAGIAAGARRIRRAGPRAGEPAAWWPLMAGVVVSLAGLFAWWLHAPLSEAGTIVADHPPAVLSWLVPAHREFALVQLFFFACILGCAVGVFEAVRRDREKGLGRLLIGVGLVGVVSVLVRLEMTAPNLYSQGAGGMERMLRYSPGDGGLGVIAAWALPGSQVGFIWPAVSVGALVSALAAPLICLLGRGLRLSMTASVLAGLVVACWPVHAMISSSDLLAGPLLTIGVAAWAFTGAAVSRDRPLLLLPAAALLAWGVWCRLDGALLLLPALGILAPASRRWSRRPELWAALAWVGLALLGRGLAWPGVSGPEPWVPGDALSTILRVGHAVIPWWLIAVVPGVFVLRREGSLGAGVLGALCAAVLSVLLLWSAVGHAAWIEGLALLLPWAALLVGVGVQEVRARVPSSVLGWGLTALVLVGVLAAPMIHRGQLETLHGPAASDHAFRESLDEVEPACGIIPVDANGAALGDAARRYRLIAWEEFDRNPDLPRGDRVLDTAPGSGAETSCFYLFSPTRQGWELVKKTDGKGR